MSTSLIRMSYIQPLLKKFTENLSHGVLLVGPMVILEVILWIQLSLTCSRFLSNLIS